MFVSLLFLQGERGVITAVMPQAVQAYALLNPILRKLHLAVQPLWSLLLAKILIPVPQAWTEIVTGTCSRGKIMKRSTTDSIKPWGQCWGRLRAEHWCGFWSGCLLRTFYSSLKKYSLYKRSVCPSGNFQVPSEAVFKLVSGHIAGLMNGLLTFSS